MHSLYAKIWEFIPNVFKTDERKRPLDSGSDSKDDKPHNKRFKRGEYQGPFRLNPLTPETLRLKSRLMNPPSPILSSVSESDIIYIDDSSEDEKKKTTAPDKAKKDFTTHFENGSTKTKEIFNRERNPHSSEDVICIDDNISAQSRKTFFGKRDGITGTRAKTLNKYCPNVKRVRPAFSGRSNENGSVKPNYQPVYDTIFNDATKFSKHRKENSTCSSASSISFENKYFNATTAIDSYRRLDRESYRVLLSKYTPIEYRKSPIPSTFSFRKHNEGVVQIEKFGKTNGETPKGSLRRGSAPVIDLTLDDEQDDAVILRASAFLPVSSQKNALKANVPLTQSAEGSKKLDDGPLLALKLRSRSSNVLDHKLYENRFMKTGYFARVRERFESSDKLSSLNIAEQETSVKLLEKKREAILQEKLNMIMHLGKLQLEGGDAEDSFPVLTPQMLERVESALKPSSINDLLVEAYNLPIRRKDIETLKGLNWLNDEIMNFYFTLLMERGKLDNYPSVYSFNTFFYPKLMSGGHPALKRWTRKVDLFSYDFVLIPVHLGMHWCLAVINFKDKKIQYYDSMGGNHNQCLEAIKKYLEAESLDKKKTKMSVSDWQAENVKDIPQQMNGSDCGMFACKYAEYVTRNKKITFKQENMPYFRQRMIYEILSNCLM